MAASHVYKVTYLVQASVTITGAITVVPQLNGVSQANFASSANATLTSPSVSVAGSFLVNTLASAAVNVGFLYNATLLANSPAGVFTVTQLQ